MHILTHTLIQEDMKGEGGLVWTEEKDQWKVTGWRNIKKSNWGEHDQDTLILKHMHYDDKYVAV